MIPVGCASRWTKAFELSGQGLGEVSDKYGGQSIFVMCGTSRVWSLGPYQGHEAAVRHAERATYQVCKGPRHFGGIMTDEMGSPWMEVEAEPRCTCSGAPRGVLNYDSANRTISGRGPHRASHICVDPRVTPLSKEADIWLPLRPAPTRWRSSWLNWIIENEAYDDTMVRRWSTRRSCSGRQALEDRGWLVEGNGGIDMRRSSSPGRHHRGRQVPALHGMGREQQPFDLLGCRKRASGKARCTRSRPPAPSSSIRSKVSWLPAGCPTRRCGATRPTPSSTPIGMKATRMARSRIRPACPKARAVPGEVAVTLKDGTVPVPHRVGRFHQMSQYTWDKAEEITGVPGEKAEEAVRAWTTRVDPRHGNGGIHFSWPPTRTATPSRTAACCRCLSCVTATPTSPPATAVPQEPVRRQPGRSNMQKGAVGRCCEGVGRAATTSLEEVAKHMQDFVQYLIDEDSPLAERYGNKVPTDEEAIVIAKRMGGHASLAGVAEPDDRVRATGQPGWTPSDSPSTATGLAGPTRTHLGRACRIPIGRWPGQRKQGSGLPKLPCTAACASPATS